MGPRLRCNPQGYESGMEATTAAALVIGIMFLLLAGGVVGWALRDRKQERLEQRVIDLRDRIEPHVRVPQAHRDVVEAARR